MNRFINRTLSVR